MYEAVNHHPVRQGALNDRYHILVSLRYSIMSTV